MSELSSPKRQSSGGKYILLSLSFAGVTDEVAEASGTVPVHFIAAGSVLELQQILLQRCGSPFTRPFAGFGTFWAPCNKPPGSHVSRRKQSLPRARNMA